MSQYQFPSDHAGKATHSHYSRIIHFHEITRQCISSKVFFQREQFWIKRLKTLTPHGLNIGRELNRLIPFSMIFSDQACDIAKLYLLKQPVKGYKKDSAISTVSIDG